MPDLPASVYGPVAAALAGAVVWSIKWARGAEKDKDAIQDKWIAYQEKQIPVQVTMNGLVDRLLKAVGE